MVMLACDEPATLTTVGAVLAAGSAPAAIPVDLLDPQGAPLLVVPAQILLLGVPVQRPANPRNAIGPRGIGASRVA